jgi:hypothetical protein
MVSAMSDLRNRVDIVGLRACLNVRSRLASNELERTEANMAGKRSASSKDRSNTTGKSGNASGPNRRIARGDPAGAGKGGVHPPNKIFTAPQKEKLERARVNTGRGRRQSDRGDSPRD